MSPKSMLKLAVVIAITAVITSAATVFAVGAIPADFLPKGEVRVLEVSAANAKNTTSTSFVNVPGLSANVIVPSGKVADLIIEFSGMVNSPDALSTRALVDSTVALPGPTQVYYGQGINLGASTHGFNYYLNGVNPGVHRVVIQWSGLGGQQFISYRSMIVIANLR